MPSARIIRSSQISNSFRVNKIKGTFDYSDDVVTNEFNVNIPIDDKAWNIGLICGCSGSGKTTIAKELFSNFYLFNGFEWHGQSFVDDFPKELNVEQITKALNSVGLSCVPDWLKPFNVLSNGQKMRAELARVFFETTKPIVYDEFTSVVDRDVAKVTSTVIEKFIRKNNHKFIAVSCHYDIIDWLNPDWVYDTNKNEFSWRCLRRRPDIELKIRKAHHSEWRLFSRYHYLNSEINTSATCFIAETNGHPVGFICTTFAPFNKQRTRRVSRLVVLPDYQGLGIGTKLLNFIGEYNWNHDKSATLLVTSLYFFAKSLSKQGTGWRLTRGSHYINKSEHLKGFNRSASTNRFTWSFFYEGEK